MPDTDLHMIRLRLTVPHLMRLIAARQFPVDKVDLGYAGHVLFTDLWGDAAPKPFAFTAQDPDGLTVLGYTNHPKQYLEDRANAFASPEAVECVQWEHFSSKVMPDVDGWGRLDQMRFTVRAAPVIRSASDTEHYSKGAEVDAFLAKCTRADDDTEIDRYAVYIDWLADQFMRHGATEIGGVQVSRFEQALLFRRGAGNDGKRVGRAIQKPAVEFKGTLKIGDPEKFDTLMRRGIGRHRAFGFGMVLLG